MSWPAARRTAAARAAAACSSSVPCCIAQLWGFFIPCRVWSRARCTSAARLAVVPSSHVHCWVAHVLLNRSLDAVCHKHARRARGFVVAFVLEFCGWLLPTLCCVGGGGGGGTATARCPSVEGRLLGVAIGLLMRPAAAFVHAPCCCVGVGGFIGRWLPEAGAVAHPLCCCGGTVFGACARMDKV